MRKSTIKKSQIRESHTLQSRLSVNSIDKTVVSDLAEPEDATQVLQWHQTMLQYFDPANQQSDSQPIGFLFRLEEISGISYRKKDPGSRLYAKLTANLYDLQLKQYYVRTYQTAALLLEPSNNRKDEYELTDNLALFFFSFEAMHDRLELQLELHLLESSKLQTILTSVYVGAWTVNPFGKVRGQARELLRPSLYSEGAAGVSAVALYTIANNESIRPLARLVPPHCICGGQDIIPGIVNSKLPHASNYLRIEYSATYLLKMQLAMLELPDSVSIEAARNAQKYFEVRTKHSIREVKTKKVQIKLSYHNGWRSVCTAMLELAEKKQLEVRNKSTMYRGTVYQGRQIAILPMVFMEPVTVISIELLYDFEGVHQSGVEALSYAVACYQLCPTEIHEQFKHYKCLLSGGPYRSLTNQLPVLSTASPIRIQFDLHQTLSDQAPLQTVQQSLQMPQFDRMEIQKSRVIQQKKKIKEQRRKLQMEYADAPRMLDFTEVLEQTYLEKLKQIQKERDANLERVQQLRQKLEQYNIVERDDDDTISEEDGEESFMGTQGVYYKTLLEPSDASRMPTSIPYVMTLADQLPSAAILRTELMEFSYASWFIFNFLSLTTESHRLPRKLTVVVRFFTEPELQTRVMEPNLTTGELIHSEYDQSQPNDKHPVYIIKVEPNPYRAKQNYLNLLSYLESNKLQLILMDETDMEFGYVLLPIHGLLRRRRQEVKQVIEAEVFYGSTIKGQFKVELTNSRQQPTHSSTYQQKVNSRAVSPRKDRTEIITSAPGKPKNDSVLSPFSNFQKVEISGDQRLKQRIQRFKNTRKGDKQQNTNSPQKQGSDKAELISRIVQQRIVVDKVICPIYMISEVFFLEFTNPEPAECSYSLAILDPDDQYYQGERELRLVGDTADALFWLQEKYLQGYQQSTLKGIDESLTFRLEKGEKVTLVFRYWSRRAYTKRELTDRPSRLKFNRQRNITVSLSNGDCLAALYRISVKPLPDIYHLRLCYYVGENQNINLVLPPLAPPDEPIQTYVECSSGQPLQWVQPNHLAVSLQTPSHDDLMNHQQFNIIVFDDESFSRVLSIWNVRVVSCQKIVANGKLGAESELMVRLSKTVCDGNQPLLLHSEDDKVVKPVALSKTPDGGVSFRLKVLPTFTDSRLFYVRVQNSRTNEVQHQLVVEVDSQQPNYKSTIKVEHKRSVQRHEENIEYVNPLPRKTQFLVSSTNPYLLRPEQTRFEAAANRSVDLKLIFFAPMSRTDYTQVALTFTDRDGQVREFVLFKITYVA